MPARLFAVCLAAALFAAPVGAAPCEKAPRLVTATYSVSDLLAADAATGPSSVKTCNLPGPAKSCPAAGPVGPAPRDDTPAEERLMDLITSAIAPRTWASVGGPGSIDYYPLGQALVINQTPDVQEQIADLLAAMRRLHEQEIALEVRIIGMPDQVAERLGVD